MAEAQEYLTGNRRIRYPFEDDSVIQQVSEQVSLCAFGCFVDAMVQMKPGVVSGNPVVTALSSDSDFISFRLKCEGDTGPGVSINCAAATDKFPVISGSCAWCWYTFVMSSDGIRELSAAGGMSGDEDLELRLSDRCVGRQPPGVTSITVYGGKKIKPGTTRRYTRQEVLDAGDYDKVMVGDVKAKAGYNMTFFGGSNRVQYETGSSERGIGHVVMNAIPGAGEGTIKCNCDDAVTYNTPGLLSPDGHTRLFNDTCYDLVPVLYSRENGDLMLHVKCKACCTCEMYAEILTKKLVPLKDAVFSNKESLDGTLGTYEKYVRMWNDRIKNAAPEDIAISCTGVPLDAAATDIKAKGDNVTGMMNRCGFSFTVRNESFVTVSVLFSEFSSNGEPFDAQIGYMDSNMNPRITKVDIKSAGGTATLPPGRSATLTLFIRLPDMVKTDRQSGFRASMRITASQSGRTIVSTVKTVSI